MKKHIIVFGALMGFLSAQQYGDRAIYLVTQEGTCKIGGIDSETTIENVVDRICPTQNTVALFVHRDRHQGMELYEEAAEYRVIDLRLKVLFYSWWVLKQWPSAEYVDEAARVEDIIKSYQSDTFEVWMPDVERGNHPSDDGTGRIPMVPAPYNALRFKTGRLPNGKTVKMITESHYPQTGKKK